MTTVDVALPVRGTDRRDRDVVVLAAAAALVAGAATGAVGPVVVVVALAGAATFVAVVRTPVLAAYLYLALLPFVAGVERGALVPLMRPNEALQLFLSLAVLAGASVRVLERRADRVRVTPLDRAVVAMALLASLWPLTWLLLRGRQPTTDDLLAALAVWRLVGLYALFRYVVRTPQQLRRCLTALLAGACVLAVIALLESLGSITIAHLLGGEGRAGRGQGTLGSSIAVGDYLAYSLAVLLALYLRGRGRRALVVGATAVIICGVLGTGQFSAWIAAVIVVVAVAAHEGQLVRLAVRAVPLAAVGLVVGWPVVAARLVGFESELGVPSSWIGRIDNLTHFYLPQLWGYQWVLGVRPESVLPAPETWREVIYLESGLLWLLWVGGVPLFLAFVWFLVAALRQTDRVSRSRGDEVGAVALAAWASLLSMAVLSVIDMHLTLRGGGDVLFALLGLSATRHIPRVDRPPEQEEAPEQVAPPSIVAADGRPPGRVPVIATTTVDVESWPSHREWDELLATVPGGDVTQASPWGRLKARSGMEVHRLVLRADGAVAGGAQVLVRRVGPLGAVAYVPYGPIVAPDVSDEAVALLADELASECRRRRVRALFVQPPEGGERVTEALQAVGFRPSDADVAQSASLRLDLALDPEELLARMARHARADVRKSWRQPLDARVGTADDLVSLADLHRCTAERHGFSPTPLPYLEALWDELHPAGQVDVVLVGHEGTDVAAILVTRLGDVVTERVRGFDPDRLAGRQRPNEALLWATLDLARRRGARWYDQGGVSRRVAEALAAGVPRGYPAIADSRWAHKVALGGSPVVRPAPLELIPNAALGVVYRAVRSTSMSATVGRSLQRRLRRASLARGRRR